jgi:hypothetical protein
VTLEVRRYPFGWANRFPESSRVYSFMHVLKT